MNVMYNKNKVIAGSGIMLNELHQIALFSALDKQQLDLVLKSFKKIKLPAKDVLFKKDSHATHFYFLKSGQIKLFCLSADGCEKVIEIIYPLETFAEAIMFMDEQTYPVNAGAIKDCELYSFEIKQFRDLLDDSKETCFRMMKKMSRKLHDRIDDINSLTLHNATYRLVVYLLEQLPEGAMELSAIHLSTTKVIIASRLSIQPETFSRILLQMSKQELVEVHGNDIILLDVDGLRALL